MSDRYALADPDGGWWYHLGTQYSPPKAVEASPGGDLLEAGQRPGWWRSRSVEPLAAVVLVRDGPRPVLGYDRVDLPDELAAVLPKRLTVDEYRERSSWDDGDPEAKQAAARLYQTYYRPEHAEPSVRRELVDLSDCVRLEGMPPGAVPEGATWRATLPFELRERPEYLHLFPGALRGFRAALAKRLSAVPGVSAHDQSTFSIYASVRGRTVELVKAGYAKSPPHEVEGANLAQAAERWEALVAVYVAMVEESTRRGTCPRCKGTGDVAGAVEPDEVKVRALAEKFRKYAGRSPSLVAASRPLAEIAVREMGG